MSSSKFISLPNNRFIDLAIGRISIGLTDIEIPTFEYKVLEYLIKHEKQVLSLTQLADYAYENEYRASDSDQAIRSAIYKLRNKYGLSDVIKTKRGVGYYFERPQKQLTSSSQFSEQKLTLPENAEADTNIQEIPLIFPFYVDSFYIKSIYEQIQVYTESELLCPQFNQSTFSEENRIDINGIYCKEEKPNFSDQSKILKIIQIANNDSLSPMNLYECLTSYPNKNIIFAEGTFRLMGIYNTSGNTPDWNKQISSTDDLTWHLKYVNTGVDGTDFSVKQGDTYVCQYARGRDIIYDIDMYLSGNKLVLSARHMTYMIKPFATFKLKVLGHIIRNSHNTASLSIKPLAVYHES